MPEYDFRCKRCGKEFSGLARMSGRNEVRCACGSETTILLSGKIGISVFPSGHNYGLGCYTGSKYQESEAMKKLEYTDKCPGTVSRI